MFAPSMSRLDLHAVALLASSVSIYCLSRRYYATASYERGVHFFLLTLLITGATLQIASRQWSGGRQSLDVFVAPSQPSPRPAIAHDRSVVRTVVKVAGDAVGRSRRMSPDFAVLLLCLVMRGVLFWYTVRVVQCTWQGVEAFLPLFTLGFDLIWSKSAPLRLGHPAKDGLAHPSGNPRAKKQVTVFAVASLFWSFSVMSTIGASRIATGTICPVGFPSGALAPLFQFVMCAVDAAIIVRVSNIRCRSVEANRSIGAPLSKLCLAAALGMLILCIPNIPTDNNPFWIRDLHWPDVRDLTLDSLLVSIALLGGIYLLAALHPTTVASHAAFLGSLGWLIPNAGSMLLLSPLSRGTLITTGMLTAVWSADMWFLPLPPTSGLRPSATASLHKWLPLGFMGMLALCVLYSLGVSSPRLDLSLERAINTIISIAQADADQWALQAATSKTLDEAVAQYQHRYGIPPPPHFDKWFEFAVKHDSAILDDFGQIHEDLLPFWGLEPAEVRARTAHLFRYGGLDIGGLRIRNGAVEQSPFIPGTHRWMTTSLEKMIEPFAQWLPDMDFAMNLSDESRVSVPYEKMQELKAAASQNRARSSQSSGGRTSAAKLAETPWPKEFEEPRGDVSKTMPSPDFVKNFRRVVFYDWVAATCPPDAPARNWHWWDWSTACVDCASPHSLLTHDAGAIMANATLAHDLCHQPDVAFLDGFVMCPGAMIGTRELYPVFSQGRVGGFSDILIPSPWNFDGKSSHDEDLDVPWDEKSNGLFWRGSLSDGYAAFGVWVGFVRARFVHESYQRTQSPIHASPSSPLTVNVSITGEMSRCHDADCAAERRTFQAWSRNSQTRLDENTGLPGYTPFEEHWHYRHLFDMDGSGFSGRFIPFLHSRSLVYRAALFKAWFDERLTPWYHYVPVDIRLGTGFWSVIDFLAGKGQGGQVSGQGGEESARKMAEQGSVWAKRVLRPEDSQIYMFRLLLEWGRIVSDDRENLAFRGSDISKTKGSA